MVNLDSQIILYAKGWFKISDTMEDLRKIYAKRNCMTLEYISDENIYSMLTNLVFDLCLKNKTSYPFTNLMAEIFRFQDGRFGYSQITRQKNVIKKYLSMLCLLKIKQDDEILIELDKPDYSILSKNEE